MFLCHFIICVLSYYVFSELIAALLGLVMKIVKNVSETPDLSYCVEFCNQTLEEMTGQV